MPPSFSGPYSYQAHTTTTSKPSIALPFAVAPAMGDLVVLELVVFHPPGGASVTDNYGNTWTPGPTIAGAGSIGIYSWWTLIAATGAGFAATFLPGGGGNAFMSAAAVGVAPTSPPVLDGSHAAQGTTGTTAAAGAYNRQGTGAFDVFFAAAINNGQAWTAGVPPNVLQNFAGVGSGGSSFLLAYQSNGTAGSLSPSATYSVAGDWAALGISFANFFLPGMLASPATIASVNPLGTTVTLTGSHTSWTSGTTFSLSGVANTSILSQSVNVGTQVATLTIGTGAATGTLTIGNSTDASTTTIGVVAQPVTITPYVTTSGQVLMFIVQAGTPAANGQIGDVALTAMASDPTVTVNGSPVALGPRTWASTNHNKAYVCYLLPSVLLPTDVLACSWPTGWFATALGSPLAQSVPAANYTGQVEPAFAVPKTMLVGFNTGSQPSRSSGGNFLGKDLFKHAGAWIPGTGTTIFGLDSAGNPTSWTPGGFVIRWVNGNFDNNQVDAQGLPTLMGTYAAQYDDPKVGTSDAWNVNLIGDTRVAITHTTTMVSGTTVTILWGVQYVADVSNLEPFLELTVQSAPGLFANPTQPNLWVFGPGSTIDRSDPLAASEPAIARLTSARGRTPEWLRSMDADGGSFGEIDNMPYAADLIDANHAYWDYARPITTQPIGFPTARACNFDPAKGPAGDGTYSWVTTRYYGDPGQSCYVQGPDSVGYYEPIAATDKGASLWPPQSGAQARCVIELKWPVPHGLRYGYSLSISQDATAINGATNNGAGLVRISTTLAYPFVDGQLVRVAGVGGVPASTGIFPIAAIDSHHFDLLGTTFAGSYTSGGTCFSAIPLQQSQSVGITNISNVIFLISGPDTVMFAAFCGGTATPSTSPITVTDAAEHPSQFYIHGTAPAGSGNVPYEFSSALAATLGSKRWLNLPLKGTAGVHQEIARRVASRTPYGATMLVEVGNEIWNNGFPDSQECTRLSIMASYLPTGTKLWNGKYTVMNGVKVPGGLYGVYPLIASAVMDTFAAELTAIGRGDIVVKRVLGTQFSAPTVTQSLLQTCVSYGLSFDYVSPARYVNMGTDAPFVAAFANGSGWSIAALCDLAKHDFFHDTANQDRCALHAGYIASLMPAAKMVGYEGFPQLLQPIQNAAQYHDILAHPFMYNVMTAYLCMVQRGQPTVTGSGMYGINLYQGFSSPGTVAAGGTWMTLAGLYQRPGYGLANRFATAAGGAPADGKSHYGPSWTGGVQDFDGNESPGHQAVLDWIDATGAATNTPFREALYAKLKKTAAITAIVGGAIYPGDMPITRDLLRDGPALTYTVTTYPGGHVLSGSDGTATATVDISAWAYQESQADALALVIWNLLEGVYNDETWLDDFTVMSALQKDEVDLPRRTLGGGDVWMHQVSSTWEIKHRIAIPTLDGFVPTQAPVLTSRTLVAGAGSYHLSGASATLLALTGRVLVAGSGSYHLSGASATLLAARKLAASAGSYSLTGRAASLSASSGGRTLLGPSDFTYLGSYLIDGTSLGSGLTFAEGLTHRYVGGQLRFLTFGYGGSNAVYPLYEFNLGSGGYFSTLTAANQTNAWTSIWPGTTAIGSHVSPWWDEAKGGLWTSSAQDYPDDGTPGSDSGTYTTSCVQFRNLNSDGTISNCVGPYGFDGVGQRAIYGGVRAIPASMQAQCGGYPYMYGWGGYTSRMAQGLTPSLGLFAVGGPDVTGYTSPTAAISTADFKVLADHRGGATSVDDWYNPASADYNPLLVPTSIDRGRRSTDPTNYFDAGDPRPNPTTRPTVPPVSTAGWLSPAPDGAGRWVWGDNYFETGTWVDGPSKYGFVAVASLFSGFAYYANSTLNCDSQDAEIHVFDPADFAAVVAATRQPWQVQPASMKVITGDLVGQGIFYGKSGNQPTGAISGATFDATTNILWFWATAVSAGYDCLLAAYSVNC